MNIPYYTIPSAPQIDESKGAKEQVTLVSISFPISGLEEQLLDKIHQSLTAPNNPIHLAIEQESISVAEMINIYPSASFLFFGIQVGKILPNVRPATYHIYKIKGRQIVFADELNRIEADMKKKRLLWNSLKSLFPQ